MRDDPADRLRDLFREHFNAEPYSVTALAAHASKRNFYRLQGDQSLGAKVSVVGIVDANSEARECFIEFSRHFHAAGLPVPEILIASEDRQYCLETDLGDRSLYDLIMEQRSPSGAWPTTLITLYENVIDLLPRFQIDIGPTLPARVFPRINCFNSAAMLSDVRSYNRELLVRLGVIVDEAKLLAECQKLTERLHDPQYPYFMHRDFQSRNIMIVDDSPWVIDYQSAKWGPLEYDLAALLFQVRAEMPGPIQEALLERYLDRVNERTEVARDRFRERYFQIALLRFIQVLEAYGRVGLGESKEYFLKGIAPALELLQQLMDRTGLRAQLPVLEASVREAQDRFLDYQRRK